MRRCFALISGLGLAAGVCAQEPAPVPPPPDELVAAAQELGRINGLALACNYPELVVRIKGLMVGRMPKARRYGEAFDEATSAAFVATPGGCAEAAVLNVQAELAASRLPEAEK